MHHILRLVNLAWRVFAEVSLLIVVILGISCLCCEVIADELAKQDASQVVYGFLGEIAESAELVDTSGSVLPEWKSVSRYVSPPVGRSHESCTTKPVVLVVPDNLRPAVKAACVGIWKKIDELSRSDKRLPIVPVAANAVEPAIFAQLTDPRIDDYHGISENHTAWQCGFSGVVKRETPIEAVITVSRIVFIPPLSAVPITAAKQQLGVLAHLIDNEGESFVPFVSLKVIGNPEFIQLCRLREPIDTYIADQVKYRNHLLVGTVEKVRENHEKLRAAVESIAIEARSKVCSVSFLRDEFQAIGLRDSVAGDAARELATKSGKRVVDLLEETFNGSNDPLVSALKLMKCRGQFAKAVPPQVLEYASAKYADRFGVRLVDDESVYLCSVSAALLMHANFLVSQRVLDESFQLITAAVAASDDESLSSVREKVLRLTAQDFPKWSAASELMKQLPPEPSPPSRPVDPYVKQAEIRRMAEMDQQRVSSQAAEQKRRVDLERQMRLAEAKGDTDGFFEAGERLGATTLVDANNPELAAQLFGTAGRVEAVEHSFRQKEIELMQSAPLVVQRPADFEARPEWVQFVRDTEEFPKKLAEYEGLAAARKKAILEAAKQLEPNLKKKQEKAIAEIDRFISSRALNLRRATQFIKSNGEKVVDAPADETKGWYIPSFSGLTRHSECVVLP